MNDDCLRFIVSKRTGRAVRTDLWADNERTSTAEEARGVPHVNSGVRGEG